MKVAGVIRSTESIQIERHHSRCVSAVDEDINAARLSFFHQPLDGQHHPGLTGRMIDQKQPRPRRDFLDDGLHHLALARQRKRDRSDRDPSAAIGCDGIDGVAAGVVLVVGHQQLGSRLQPEATKDRVDAGGRRHIECEIVCPCSKETRQNGARLIELSQVVVIEEEQRFAFDA